MKENARIFIFLLTACCCLESAGLAQEGKRDILYTEPDEQAKGGIRGRIERPARTPENVLAIPADNPTRVYQAELGGPDQRSFGFSGLPMDRYDLMVIYEDMFYEGLRLHRGENTLTQSDLKSIDEIIQRSEPFFNQKIIYRVEGSHGRGEYARAICAFYRDEKVQEYRKGLTGYRRTFKLVMLKDVGPGWQVVRARDLHPVWTTPQLQRAGHRYHAELSSIRVTDSVRDIGALTLD